MTNAKVWSTAAAVVWFGLGGCGGEDDTGGSTGGLPTHRGSSHVAAEVDIAGGLLALESGVEVSIPRDALGNRVRVELEELDQSALPQRRSADSLDKPVAFRPHGQTFERDVTIEIPLAAIPEGRSARLLRLDDEDDTDWEEVEGFRVRGANELETAEGDRRQRLSFDTRHFSVYWVVAEASSTTADGGGATDRDGGFSVVDAGTSTFDGGSPIATCRSIDCEIGFTCIEDDSGPRCVAATTTVDAGSGGAPEGGTGEADGGTGLDSGTGEQDAGIGPDAAFDAGTMFASCSEAFTDLGGPPSIDCTDEPDAFGYSCEGVLGSNAPMNCHDFCASFGSACVNIYSTTGNCSDHSTQTPLPCDPEALPVYSYCTCGTLSQGV